MFTPTHRRIAGRSLMVIVLIVAVHLAVGVAAFFGIANLGKKVPVFTTPSTK